MIRLTRSHYNAIFESGSLRGLMDKIKIGYALNIFGINTYNELNIIREIRNAFAHSLHQITFSVPEVKQHCERLKIGMTRRPRYISSVIEDIPIPPQTPRQQ